jgi:hypothetical protein
MTAVSALPLIGNLREAAETLVVHVNARDADRNCPMLPGKAIFMYTSRFEGKSPEKYVKSMVRAFRLHSNGKHRPLGTDVHFVPGFEDTLQTC